MMEAWMKCKLDKGMFPGELGISFVDSSGNEVSLYASEKFVNKEQSAILVTVLGKNDQYVRVRLPDQSFSGTTVVDVSLDSLREGMRVA